MYMQCANGASRNVAKITGTELSGPIQVFLQRVLMAHGVKIDLPA